MSLGDSVCGGGGGGGVRGTLSCACEFHCPEEAEEAKAACRPRHDVVINYWRLGPDSLERQEPVHGDWEEAPLLVLRG